MKTFKNFLSEDIYDNYYHGSPNHFINFDPKKLGNGHDQYGPGFYFTNNKETALRYAENGYIFYVTLIINNPISGDEPIDENIAKKMIYKSELVSSYEELMEKFEDDENNFWNSPLSDWDENPSTAFNNILNSILEQKNAQESMQTIWYDVFKANNTAYMKSAIELGYDGVILKNIFDRENFIICFNPDNITINNIEKL